MADRIGQQFGNYRLIRLLGEGGFAEVYLGEHIHLETNAAIKILTTKLTDEEITQFRNEARILITLEHPNIVRVFDFGMEGRIPFIVMGYAPYGSLRKKHPKSTRLPLSTIVTYVKQIASALQYVHDHKLIHRDIKPENMLVGRNNEILLSDFGIAAIAHASLSLKTQEGSGTIYYMAPEQIQGKPRPSSDQYSLGIVVYEWLTGLRPFNGTYWEIATQHLSTLLPPFDKSSAIPTGVEQILMTALAKDGKHRFASVQAFANALEQACQPEQISTVLSPTSDSPLIYDTFREPDDPSDLAEHPHKKVFPARNEGNSLRFGWQIVGASRRGFGHAYEGKYREDDFNVRIYGAQGQQPDIAMIAIADGVSGKSLSRRGARAAVLGATELADQRMNNLRFLIAHQTEREKIAEETFTILMEALRIARYRIEESAAYSRVSVEELQSTLLVYLAMPRDENSLLVASTQIGDGALFLLRNTKQDKWNWIQQPQIQSAGNEVHPFMRSTKEEWERYFNCHLLNQAQCIMGMTDGTADDIEPPRATRENPNPDQFVYVHDFYARIVLPTFTAPQPGEELAKLLAYQKKTSHDDRTVICLYRQ